MQAMVPREPRGVELDKVYINRLPVGISEPQLTSIMGQYCQVVSVKILPPVPGKEGQAAFVKCSNLEDAKWIIDNLHFNIPSGLSEPVICRYAGEPARRDEPGIKGKGKGRLLEKSYDGIGGSRNIYVKGLPRNTDEHAMKELFGQYVTVLHAKVLPMTAGRQTSAGFLRCSEEDAQWAMENMNEQNLNGLDKPLLLVFADVEKGKGKGKPQPGPISNCFMGPLAHLAEREGYQPLVKLERPGDWYCPNCKDLQFARNMACKNCQTPKPAEAVSAEHPSQQFISVTTGFGMGRDSTPGYRAAETGGSCIGAVTAYSSSPY